MNMISSIPLKRAAILAFSISVGIVVASAGAYAEEYRSYNRDDRAYHREDSRHHRVDRTYGRIAVQSLYSVAGFRFSDGPIKITVHYPHVDDQRELTSPDTCVMRAPTACETSHPIITGEDVLVSVRQHGRSRHAAYKLDHIPQSGRDDIVVEK